MCTATDYLYAKRALIRAALAYALSPSNGQEYTLLTAAREFARIRERAKIETPVSEET